MNTSIAMILYNQQEQLDREVKNLACGLDEKTIEGVKYTTYHFSDKSKLTFGSNGYISSCDEGNLQ